MADLASRVAVVTSPTSTPCRAPTSVRACARRCSCCSAPSARSRSTRGAVAAGDAGALIAGMSGAGKSTLTIACALEGMSVCGDDYVVLGDRTIRRRPTR